MKLEDTEIFKILSSKINSDIVKDLLSTYDAVQKEYFEGDDESTLSKSGKFVENIFRALHYLLTNQILTEIKSGELNKISDKLEKPDGSVLSETIRVVIPRVGLTTYTEK